MGDGGNEGEVTTVARVDVGKAVVGVRPKNVWVEMEEMEEVGTERMCRWGTLGGFFEGGRRRRMAEGRRAHGWRVRKRVERRGALRDGRIRAHGRMWPWVGRRWRSGGRRAGIFWMRRERGMGKRRVGPGQ